MLRYYNEISLLKPAYIEVSTGYRYYSEDQLFYLWKNKCTKGYGFSLAEITDIINNGSMSTNIRSIYGIRYC